MLSLLQDRDRTIDQQRKEIESLKRQNKVLEVKARRSADAGRAKPNITISETDLAPKVMSRDLADLHPRGDLARFSLSSSRSLEALETCGKPPVPSRDGVNRKLHIGGAPPPPPPRGVSLKEKSGQNNGCDMAGTKDRYSSSHTIDINETKFDKSNDKFDKHDDKFDSGRESDETFDNESIKSEPNELSASPPSYTSTPSSASIFAPPRNFKEEMMSVDNKTKVTFWTDTYL